jgi:hypothetical protein
MPKLSDLAAKAARQPYDLELDDGTVLSVPQPTIAGWQAACEAPGGVAGFLTALGASADGAAKVAAEMPDLPYGTESALVIALRNYFRLGNS